MTVGMAMRAVGPVVLAFQGVWWIVTGELVPEVLVIGAALTGVGNHAVIEAHLWGPEPDARGSDGTPPPLPPEHPDAARPDEAVLLARAFTEALGDQWWEVPDYGRFDALVDAIVVRRQDPWNPRAGGLLYRAPSSAKLRPAGARSDPGPAHRWPRVLDIAAARRRRANRPLPRLSKPDDGRRLCRRCRRAGWPLDAITMLCPLCAGRAMSGAGEPVDVSLPGRAEPDETVYDALHVWNALHRAERPDEDQIDRG